MIHYDTCLVCDSSDIEHVISVKDFSVSGKTFPIWACRSCLFRFTQDIPDMTEIPMYYQFEDYISHTETKKAVSRNIKALSSENLFSLEQRFDAITMWHVLEHVHELHAYLAKIHSLLSEDGIFVVAVPNHTSRDQLAYQQYWAAYDVPRHLYHFSPTSMETLMRKHGFRLVKSLPMWFDSFYVSMLSEKYRSGKLNLISAILHGLQSNLSAVMDSKKCSSVIYVLRKDDH